MKLRIYISQLREKAKSILTIFIAPLAITFLADWILLLVKGSIIPMWQSVITFISCVLFLFLLIFGYSDKLDKLIIVLYQRKRKNKLRKPNVLILNGLIGDEGYETPPVPAITNHRPDYWEDMLRQQTNNWKIETGSIRHFKKRLSYQIVINPFGEEYPEVDTNGFSTFSDICNYVYSGGIFVNVAGIPFYYCHDSRDPKFVNRRITAGYLQKEPFEQGDQVDLVIQRPLFTTVFHQLNYSSGDSVIVDCVQTDKERLDYGEIAGAGGSNQAKAFRAFTPRMPGVIPILRSRNPELWIISSINYGDGYFIIASMDLRGSNHTSSEKIVAAIIGWVKYELRK